MYTSLKSLSQTKIFALGIKYSFIKILLSLTMARGLFSHAIIIATIGHKRNRRSREENRHVPELHLDRHRLFGRLLIKSSCWIGHRFVTGKIDRSILFVSLSLSVFFLLYWREKFIGHEMWSINRLIFIEMHRHVTLERVAIGENNDSILSHFFARIFKTPEKTISISKRVNPLDCHFAMFFASITFS